MTLIFCGLLMAVDFLAVVCQSYCVPMEMFMGARVVLYPVVLVYGALALPYPGVLALAFFNGLLWDALTVQIVNTGALAQQQVVEISLGWSIVLYAVLCTLVHGLRALFLRGRWDIHCLASGFCTSAILLSEFAMITFRRGGLSEYAMLTLHRGGLVFPREVWVRILLPGFFAMVLAPLVFFTFNWLAGLVGYPVRQEEERTR